ncbi:hypothetical protein AYL99_05318 [Fonsecaea erecta]|uniref:Metallo-beta-lactamase domain-containing protein n=1 Tax=Fonsecaea erecta TaxID=1367422 RepID=A0A178ZLN4_9EURO|nr:hypothetical protein AYL99_05318 [Fonsecaea erecta]OAP60316.1 hypothetical protein AYL99_05318 [Fonsecaea erecta]
MSSTDENSVPLYPPKPAPALHIPPGAAAKVQIIDTTSRLDVLVQVFVGPAQYGHEILRVPSFSFLVEHISSSRKMLFDLGCRKDWQQLPPPVLALVTQPGWKIEVEKDSVAQILQEAGVDVAGGAVEAIIWSHWHYDHTGDPSTFPGSTALIVGPGVKEAFLPAYPENEQSPLLATDFAGRELKVIDFEKQETLQIGRFHAIDYFGDGSFYLLDAPGHAVGHMCGLARVTSTQDGDAEDTFVLMGGDTAHHGAELRPTAYLPLPKTVSPSPYAAKYPGAQEIVDMVQEFDAADDVFVVVAHDASLLDPRVGVDWFPDGTLRHWKQKDCARKARWRFLEDLTPAVEHAEEYS